MMGRLLLTATIAAGLAVSAAHAGTEVTFVTWGGNVAQQMKQAWFEPATKDMDVDIREDSLKGSTDVHAHVASGNVFWDVVDAATDMCERGGRDGILEELDFSVIDTKGLPPAQVTKWSVPSAAFTNILAFNRKTYPDGGPQPESWADFFDVGKFPGTRFFGPFATSTLEIALLADGVKPEELYPLDVERAFRKLESFKPNITGFVSSFGAATQMVMDGEADMIFMPENRLFTATRAGANFGYTYNQGIMNFDCLVVPKEAPNKELAMRIIGKIVSPEINANIVEASGLSPANLLALEQGYVPADVAKTLAVSPENLSKVIQADNGWWAENRGPLKLNQRYNEFKAR